MTVEIKKDPQQELVLFDLISHLVHNVGQPVPVRLAAYAGCGKTHILRRLLSIDDPTSFINDIEAVTITGRAAAQLSKDGFNCKTLHSFLYNPVFDDEGNLIEWVRKPQAELLRTCSGGIIVDEASMLPFSMWKEISNVGVPSILSGDFGQLPPVDQSGNPFNAMVDVPSHVLTLEKNFRFDINSGIGAITLHLRENNSIPRMKKDGLSYTWKRDFFTVQYHKENKFDVILCGLNRSRMRINEIVRKARGFRDDIPEVGETIMCLRNTAFVDGTRINNGELFEVIAVFPGTVNSKFVVKNIDNDSPPITISVANETWETEKPASKSRTEQVFTYGYCITVHKAQGSTFNNVAYVDEDVSFFLDQKKFRYTACSRAANHLTVVL